jgi:hypothetical protein
VSADPSVLPVAPVSKSKKAAQCAAHANPFFQCSARRVNTAAKQANVARLQRSRSLALVCEYPE